MDVFWHLLLTLLLHHQAVCTSDEMEVTGAVGRSVTFNLQDPDGKTAIWNFGSSALAFVKFGDPPEASFFDEHNQHRFIFSEKGNALTISPLRLEDAGTYTAQVSGVKTIFSFTLHVYRELMVPTVTCVAQNCSAGSCQYTLSCSASGSGSGNVSYGWSTGGKLCSEGPTVLVEESPLDESPLTCTAQNPVSVSNVTIISPAALCAENTTHPSTGIHSNGHTGVVAASVVGGAVLLAVIIFIIYSNSKGWKIFHLPTAQAASTEAGAEYATVYAEVGPSQQVPLQSFSDAQQDDPKKMLSPDVEASKTIYFTVQATAQTDDEKMGKGTQDCWEKDQKSTYSLVR